MPYSIDISYEWTNDNNIDAAIFSITDKYDDCKWYASDTGPFNKDGNQKKLCINHGFQIKSLDMLKLIINEVKENPFIWIDFCTKEINNGDDCEHIYYSSNSLSNILPKFAEEYNERIKTYTGTDKEIFDLCKMN